MEINEALILRDEIGSFYEGINKSDDSENASSRL